MIKYELPNIFLHFLNKDTQEIFEIPDNQNKNLISKFQMALNVAILLCNEYCIIPLGFYFESENTKKIILDNLEFVREGLLVFAMREKEIKEYIDKKQGQLKDFIKDANYYRFFEYENKELACLKDGIISRTTKIGKYCLLRWKKNMALFIEDFSGDISTIYNLDQQKYAKNTLEIAKAIKKSSEQIDDNAFIWKIVAKEFDKFSYRDKSFEYQIRRLFESYYYRAYLDEYDASILFDIFTLDRQEDFLLKKEYISASNYRWFYTFLKCLNLDYLLNLGTTQIIKLKYMSEFILLIKIYLGLCNSKTFLHNTYSIRKEVASMCQTNKARINDLSREVRKMSNQTEKFYSFSNNNKKIAVDILVLIATDDEEKAIRKLEDWKTGRLSNGFDYYKLSINGLNFALVRGVEMREEEVAIAGQAAISELHPRYIAMAGFCAGQVGKVQLGDIIVPIKVYKYGIGKHVSGKNFLPDLPEISSFRLKPDWILKVQRFGDEWRKKYPLKQPVPYYKQVKLFIERVLQKENELVDPKKICTPEEIPNLPVILNEHEKKGYIKIQQGNMIFVSEEGKNYYKRVQLFENWKIDSYAPQTRTGVLATGSNVQEWEGIFKILSEKYDRKTIALDMEAHAVAKLAESNDRIPWIIAKGVGDFAQSGKGFDNRFIPFACQSSFCFLVEFFTKLNSEK